MNAAIDAGNPPGARYDWYRALFDHSLNAILLTDPATGGIIAANPTACRILGYPAAELLTLNRKVIADTTDPRLAVALETRARTGEFHGELTFRRADGTLFPIDVTTSSFPGPDGTPVAGIFFVDISERKRMETALRQSEEKFAKAFALNPAGIAITRKADGCYVEANPAYLQMVGYSRDELIGRRCTDLGIVSDDERALKLRTVDGQANPAPFETRLHTKGGATLDVITAIDTIEVGSEPCLLKIVVDASDQKRLQAANDRLAAIVESSGEAIVSTDMQGMIVSWNHSAERIYGYKAGDVIGQHVNTYLPPRPASDAGGILAQLRSGALVTLPDDLFVNRNGTAFDLAAVMSPVINHAGEMIGIALIARDITERKRMETAVRESEQRYRMLADAIPDVVFALDAAGRPTYVSPSIERMRGFTVEEALLETRQTRYAESSLAEVERHLAKCLAEAAEGKPLSEPYHDAEHRRKDGSTFWAETYFEPRYNPDGTFGGFVGVIRDLSERKRLEEALRRREERLRLVIENSPDVIWIWDEDGNMQFVSQALEPTYGVSPQAMLQAAALTHARTAKVPAHELTADRLLALGAPNLAFAGIWLRMQTAVKACVQRPGEKVRHETRLIMPDDQVRYMHTTYQGFRRGTAGVEVVAITHDVTETVEAREQIQETLRQLRVATDAVQNANVILEERVAERTSQLATALREIETASRLKDEFMAAVSHELRTPLTGVLGIAETLEMQITGPLTERQLRSVRSIRSSGNRLLEIVNSILRYTAVAAGNLTLQAEPCRLRELAAAAVQWVQPQVKAKGQEIYFEVDSADPTILSDADSIRQILHQLLDNAVKFTPHGGSIGVEVRSREDGRVQLVVWDTGIGIVPEQHATIFQPFIQVEGGLARRYEGIGLGLAYVARIVDMLGGTVAVKSTPGDGSRFTVTLPTQVRR